MEILTNYNQSTLQLISDDESQYDLTSFLSFIDGGDGAVPHTIKLSVFSEGGSFLRSGNLDNEEDFYIGDNNLFLKPNEFLDREGFTESNYNLQFDFLIPYIQENIFYISEISPTRKEIRLNLDLQLGNEIDKDRRDDLVLFLNNDEGMYEFNSFLELSNGRLISINSYAFDKVSQNKRTLILKLNELLPSDIQILNTDFNIVNKFLSSQTEAVFFIDRERLAISGFGLEIDEGYIIEDDFEQDPTYTNYNQLTGSYGDNPFDELERLRKDINLNIDYSKFANHAFFGSAESKLKNFRTKAVKLEGLYTQISSSLSFSSSKNIIDKRKDLFKQVGDIQDNFTSYEHFLYNDGQSYSTASAPGIGTNLAGTSLIIILQLIIL